MSNIIYIDFQKKQVNKGLAKSAEAIEDHYKNRFKIKNKNEGEALRKTKEFLEKEDR